MAGPDEAQLANYRGLFDVLYHIYACPLCRHHFSLFYLDPILQGMALCGTERGRVCTRRSTRAYGASRARSSLPGSWYPPTLPPYATSLRYLPTKPAVGCYDMARTDRGYGAMCYGRTELLYAATTRAVLSRCTEQHNIVTADGIKRGDWPGHVP
eukprot:2182155-Rhodomonas_salina.2